MTFSGHTDVIRSTHQKSSRSGERVRSIIIHHAATTDAAGVVSLMETGARTVSSNYVVARDGTVYGVVPEEERAWTSGSATDGGRGAAWDRRSVTFEVANETYGGSWPISEASYEAVSDVMADVANRYGFELNRDTVLGHRELWTRHRASYPTACPGGFDLDRLVNMARAKQGKGAVAPATGGATPIPVFRESISVSEYQGILAALGYNLGPSGVDGQKGAYTVSAIKAFQRAEGLDVDGLVGDNTAARFRARAGGAPRPTGGLTPPPFPLPVGSYFGPKEGPAQSVSGYYSHREDLRRAMNRMIERGYTFPRFGADGLYGSELGDNVAHFQRDKGLDVDRLIGVNTWNALWTAPVT